MEISQFKRILQAFAEEPRDVDVRLGGATLQIRDEVFDIQLKFSDDENKSLLVTENSQDFAARTWLLTRVAKLPQLADRLVAVCGSSAETGLPFVRPSALLSADLSKSADNDAVVQVQDAVSSLTEFAEHHSPGATSVWYLTSDAGEGKTTVINRVAWEQAKRFKERQASSLVVPIPLSGRAFLTFDDAVIAALVNKLRFNYFYFDAFLWLVRLGAVVPAFDGYEEMLVEGSKGEAVSALGGLVQSLESSGSLIIATRKAFFDYVSFKSQAKLLDAIGNHSATFSKLELSRWSRAKSLEYGRLKNVLRPEVVYDTIADRLGQDHPLLTRAVLVTRLFEVARSDAEVSRLAELLGANPQDFFFTFVDALVTREANVKWLARVSGELMEPLISPAEHHELLSQIAVEMWQSSSRHIKLDTLDALMELFAESHKKSGAVTRQIKERVKQHSLLATDSSRPNAICFDHEDFQDFYLGEGLGRLLAAGVKSDLYAALAVNVLSTATIVQAVQYVIRKKADISVCLEQVRQINAGESGFSFCKENCAVVALRLSEHQPDSGDHTLRDMYFPAESLRGRNLARSRFERCYFQPTAVTNARFSQVFFTNCEFERIDLDGVPGELRGCEFHECRVDSILWISGEEYVFDPTRIAQYIGAAGGKASNPDGTSSIAQEDDRLKLLSRFFRIFMRTTQVNEEVIRVRLGGLAPKFFDEILPELEAKGILSEVTWEGRGVQRRFRLAVPMSAIDRSFELGAGSFDGFLKAIAE